MPLPLNKEEDETIERYIREFGLSDNQSEEIKEVLNNQYLKLYVITEIINLLNSETEEDEITVLSKCKAFASMLKKHKKTVTKPQVRTF